MKVKKTLFLKSLKFLEVIVVVVLIIILGVCVEVILSKAKAKTEYQINETIENQSVIAKEEMKTDIITEKNNIEEENIERSSGTMEYKMNSVPSRAISCWGDSMMEGIGKGKAIIYTEDGQKDISYYDTPTTIQKLTLMDTYNFGSAGENSYEITLRAGGIGMYTDREIWINNCSGTNVSFIDANGKIVYMEDYSGCGNEYKDYSDKNYQDKNYLDNSYPDTVVINDRLCQIERDYNSNELLIFLCSSYDEVGYEEIYIPQKSLVVPQMAFEHKNDILILEMGSNGGWNNDYQELIYQYQSIIDFCECSDYIIVGDTDNPGTSEDIFQEIFDENGEYIGTKNTNWEAALQEAFGNHFLNTRVYLIENGLSDCGLIQTQEDIIDAQMGFISTQLRADWTHFNSYGYYSKGKAIYLKGMELGYWE